MKYKLLSLSIVVLSFSLASFGAEFSKPAKEPSLKLFAGYEIAKQRKTGTFDENVLKTIAPELKEYVDFWSYWLDSYSDQFSVAQIFRSDFLLESLLVHAILFGSSPIVKEIIMAGANPNATFYSSIEEKNVPILFFVQYNPEILNTLLDMGADINAQDERGVTLLHRAVSKENEELVTLLIKAGANPLIETKQGLSVTPLMLAEMMRFYKIRSLLQKYTQEYIEQWQREHPE